MKERMNEIRNIEDKYGLIQFGMGLFYLVDVGHRHLSEIDIEESVKQIMGEKDAADGVTMVMTPEFQCEILRCAAELSNFSILTLFAYIKKYVEVSGL
jgi:hypothetical protein